MRFETQQCPENHVIRAMLLLHDASRPPGDRAKCPHDSGQKFILVRLTGMQFNFWVKNPVTVTLIVFPTLAHLFISNLSGRLIEFAIFVTLR